MSHIVIHESDPLIREHVRDALVRLKRADNIAFEESKSDQSLQISLKGTDEVRENDVFTKPLRLGEVLDRILFHEAQAEAGEKPPIHIGPYILQEQDSALENRESGASIRLTDKEKHILAYLHANKGEIVERDTLLDEVWGYAEGVETHTLETHIYRLRQKIEKDPAQPEIVVTTAQGYTLGDV